MNMKRVFKLTLLLLVLILTMTTMTGCVGAAEIKRYDEEFADAPAPSGYALVKYSDQLYAMTDDGSYKEIFGLVIRRMSAKQPITGVLAPIPIFRQIAKMMARSVLGGTFAPDPYDDSTDGKWGKISFSPSAILSATNRATIDALEGGTLQTVYDALTKVAMAVLFTVWFMGFVSSAASEQISLETALKSLLQLVCGMIIVLNSDIFAKGFAALGNFQLADGSEIAVGSNFTAFVKQIEDLLDTVLIFPIAISAGKWMNFALACLWFDVNSLIVILMLAYPFYQAVRAAYKVVSIMISRYFELTFGVAVAPIALALSSQRGFDHSVIMYLRKIAASALQPLMILMAAMSFESIMTMVLSIFGSGARASSLTGLSAIIGISCSYMVFSAFVGETKHIAKEFIAH